MNAPQYFVDHEGNRTSVLLDIASYNELLERLEDAEDIRLGMEALRDDPVGLPLDEARAEIEAERARIWGTT